MVAQPGSAPPPKRGGHDGLFRGSAVGLNTQPSTLTQFGYDSASRLQGVTNGALSATYSYLANSPLVEQIAFATNSTLRMTTTKQFDLLNRLTQVTNAPVAAAGVKAAYTYNPANQRTALTNADNSYWVYGYDSLGQVTSGKKYWSDGTPVAGQQFEYGFDDIGNRTRTRSGGDAKGANLRQANYSATDLNPITHTYTAAGEYFPVVTVQTTAGRFSSEGGWNAAFGRLRINVQLPPQQVASISVTDPVDLKWMPGGYLYVLSRSTATIKEYNTADNTVVRSRSSIGTTPTGLDVDAAGNVYVALSGDHQVVKLMPMANSFTFDPSFNNTGRIGKPDKTAGTGEGQFNTPFDVAVTPDGEEIAVSDSGNHRIQRFKRTGEFLQAFGQQGSGAQQFNTPKGVTYGDGGYLYIVDSSNSRIVVALSSAVIGTSGTSGTSLGQFQGPVNLCVGSRGIYVADTGNNRVQALDPIIGGGIDPTPFSPRLSLSTELGLSQPNAVAAVADFLEEKVCIADTGNNRVIIVKLPADNPEAVWTAMENRLIAQDISGALAYFSTLSVDRYRQTFFLIGASDRYD